VDARERLRRYLEQRREMGESELVLDKMSVDDVLSMVSARGTLKRRERPRAASRSPPRRAAACRGAAGRGGAAALRDPQGLPAAADEVDDEPDGADADEPVDDGGAPADHPALRGGARPRPPQSSEPAAARAGPVSDPDGASESADWRAALRGADAPTAATPTPSPEVSSVPSDALGGLVTGAPFPGLDGVLVGVVHAGAPAPLFDGDGIRALPSLDAVAETVRRCTRCPLYKTATHGVPGEGNPEADFVVVGEAPGADEDASGRPFVGASGQLLTKILSAINLAREDVFICNVVKHRPPGNRNPAPDEVAACSPYLIRQLELVRPKVILTVGNFAAQTLLDTKLGIGKLRGQVHLYRGCRSSRRTTPPRSCATPPGSAPPGKMSSLPVDFSIAPPPRVDPVPGPPAPVLAGRRAGRARRDAPRPGRDPARRGARRRHDVLPRGAPAHLPRGPRPLGARRGRRAADARRGAGAPRGARGERRQGVHRLPHRRGAHGGERRVPREDRPREGGLRRLIEVSTAVVTDAFEGRKLASELLDEAEGKIFQIGQAQGGASFTRIKELLWPAMERIEAQSKAGAR
jgi:DNA polymerase